jgi:uncharacterized SAM-binding protein YcdF (DUF218 family)
LLWEIGNAVKSVLLPPLVWGWLLLFGWAMFRRTPRAARWSIGLGVALLYASACPFLAGSLTLALQTRDDAPIPGSAQAIVVLAGGRGLKINAAGEVVEGYPGLSTSQRLLHGVRLARATGLPLLVSSGKPDGRDPAEAIVMRDVLVRDILLAPKWVEAESRNTVENAAFSARILKRERIHTVVLVTDAMHMRRARYLFERNGLVVVPAPTGVASGVRQAGIRDFVPSLNALNATGAAFNELGGMAYAWGVTAFAAATPATAVAN